MQTETQTPGAAQPTPTATPAEAKPAAAAKAKPAKPAVAKAAPAKASKAKATPKTAKPSTDKPAAAKPPASTPVKAAAPKLPKAPKAPKAPKPAAPKKAEAKPAKIKMIRDSFTFPEADHSQLAALKKRVVALGQDVKKGELVRAGIALLTALDDKALLGAVTKVDRLKTGRPKK